MISFLPSSEEYNLILKEYREIEQNVQVFTDSITDPAFFLGKISAYTQAVDVLNSCGIDVPDEFYETLAILRMHSVGMISRLTGDKGYADIIKSYSHPLLAKKDFVC